MDKVSLLYIGEITRMRKYGIGVASLATAFLWLLALHFSSSEVLATMFPLLIFMDATMMSLLFAGVTIIFENQENALKTLFVAPVSKGSYLLAKTLAIVTSSLLTLAFLLTYGIIYRGLSLSVPALIAAVGLISFTFTQFGVILTFYSKDFTDLLMAMMKFIFVLALPTILEAVNILQADWLRIVQYFNPTKHAFVLLQATTVPTDRFDLLIAIAFLAVLGLVLYTVGRRLLDSYIVKGGGV